MSLFIDVTESLSNPLKASLIEVIRNEQKHQERSVRKLCETCIKYLDYGELRYDKMEDGVSRLQDMNLPDNPLFVLLMAVLKESLDEDQIAIEYLADFSQSATAEPFRQQLVDFITIGRFMTLGEYAVLENAGSILVERYTDEDTLGDALSNLYLKAEASEYLPVHLNLISKAKEMYPDNLKLEGFSSFIHMKAEQYDEALLSLQTIREKLEQDKDNRFYHFNLASTWESIADCYLKLGHAEKAIESCNAALTYDESSVEYRVGMPILYKKAEAFLLRNEKEQALAIVSEILKENEEDERALEIRKRIV
jgi:tetratricopeptide (TPR) repeat protein